MLFIRYTLVFLLIAIFSASYELKIERNQEIAAQNKILAQVEHERRLNNYLYGKGVRQF